MSYSITRQDLRSPREFRWKRCLLVSTQVADDGRGMVEIESNLVSTLRTS